MIGAGTPARRAAWAAWLAAIARDGWQGVTLESAAALAGLPPARLIADVGDRTDAVAAFAAHVAAEAQAGAAEGAGGALSTRDRLFDGLMRGFDALQAERDAVLALWNSRDPGVAALVLGLAGPSLRRLASAAGVPAGGLRGPLRQLALGALLLKLFDSWRRDDSPDMAATMAELDRLLTRAERAETEGLSPDLLGLPGLGPIVDRLGFRRGRDDQAPPPSPGPGSAQGR
jgi:hypothetical protein